MGGLRALGNAKLNSSDLRDNIFNHFQDVVHVRQERTVTTVLQPDLLRARCVGDYTLLLCQWHYVIILAHNVSPREVFEIRRQDSGGGEEDLCVEGLELA